MRACGDTRNPPENKRIFPYRTAEIMQVPTHVCGQEVHWPTFLVLMLAAELLVIAVATAFVLEFESMKQEPVRKFLRDGVSEYIGAGGLCFFLGVLTLWSSVSGYFLLRTGNLDLYGFFHIAAPPSVGLATMRIFTTGGLRAMNWELPRSNMDQYFVAGAVVPLVALGMGYLVYIIRIRKADLKTLCDTWKWGYYTAPILTLLKFAWAAGMEEVGWSGVLFPQLLHATDNYVVASLIAGAVWGIWHSPLVIGGGYNNNTNPFSAALMMIWMTVSWAFFHMWLRVKSFSLWPVVLAHTAHNVYIELIFDPLVGRSEYLGFRTTMRRFRHFYFVGEFGVIGVASYLVVAVACIADIHHEFLKS